MGRTLMDQGLASPEHKAGSARAAPGLSGRRGRPALGGRAGERRTRAAGASARCHWSCRLFPEALPRATARHPLADSGTMGRGVGVPGAGPCRHRARREVKQFCSHNCRLLLRPLPNTPGRLWACQMSMSNSLPILSRCGFSCVSRATWSPDQGTGIGSCTSSQGPTRVRRISGLRWKDGVHFR